VSYMDSHYRTIPNAASRGLTGHSMGGYGAVRIGMKHPEVFSSIYVCICLPVWKGCKHWVSERGWTLGPFCFKVSFVS
jgi:enterochelin esterase-like enzyme